MSQAGFGSFISGWNTGYGSDSQKLDPLSSGSNASPAKAVPQTRFEDESAAAGDPEANATQQAPKGSGGQSGFKYDTGQTPSSNLLNYLGQQFGSAMAPNRGEGGKNSPAPAPPINSGDEPTFQPMQNGQAGTKGAPGVKTDTQEGQIGGMVKSVGGAAAMA